MTYAGGPALCLISGLLMTAVVGLYWAAAILAGAAGVPRPEGWAPLFEPRLKWVRALMSLVAAVTATTLGGAMLYLIVEAALR